MYVAAYDHHKNIFFQITQFHLLIPPTTSTRLSFNMRIGTSNDFSAKFNAQIWRLIASKLNQTLEWVPESIRHSLNISAFDSIRLGRVDSTEGVWKISAMRMPIVKFTLPIRIGELALRVSAPTAVHQQTVAGMFRPRIVLCPCSRWGFGWCSVRSS